MNKKNFTPGASLLDEVAMLKILGGTSSTDSSLVINIGKGCSKNRWADCKTICDITTMPSN
jgi:hypothetical protein